MAPVWQEVTGYDPWAGPGPADPPQLSPMGTGMAEASPFAPWPAEAGRVFKEKTSPFPHSDPPALTSVGGQQLRDMG